MRLDLPAAFAQETITNMLKEHPQLVEIFRKYKIDCVSCGSTSCLFKNVIATHSYDRKISVLIEEEINQYLSSIL